MVAQSAARCVLCGSWSENLDVVLSSSAQQIFGTVVRLDGSHVPFTISYTIGTSAKVDLEIIKIN
jgi:hypothetical protein